MAETYPNMPGQPAAAPKSGMSTTAKVILGILALLGVCCIAGVIAVVAGGAWFTNQIQQGMVTDPAQAAQQGQAIVNYDLPSGYQEAGAMNMLGFMDMVFISRGGTNSDSNLVILLASFSIPGMSESDTEQMKEQMQTQLSGTSSSGGIQFTQVDSREVVINGEPTTLTISEGENEGETFRQAAAGFTSNDGKPAMVMIMGPVSEWDDDAINEFIASME